VKQRMRDARKFVALRLSNLQALFGAEAVTVRAEIAKHVQKITLTPEGRTYIASGTWNVLGPWQHGWCRGPESNWLRPPFQGGALPVSYPGTVESVNFRGARMGCQIKAEPGSGSA
jgi:hypothetical protein